MKSKSTNVNYPGTSTRHRYWKEILDSQYFQEYRKAKSSLKKISLVIWLLVEKGQLMILKDVHIKGETFRPLHPKDAYSNNQRETEYFPLEVCEGPDISGSTISLITKMCFLLIWVICRVGINRVNNLS